MESDARGAETSEEVVKKLVGQATAQKQSECDR